MTMTTTTTAIVRSLAGFSVGIPTRDLIQASTSAEPDGIVWAKQLHADAEGVITWTVLADGEPVTQECERVFVTLFEHGDL